MNNENAILRASLQLGIKPKIFYPESVLLGLAKLLLMDESSLASLFTSDELMDLEKARKVMSDNKLDLGLMRSGLLLLYSYIRPDEEQNRILEEFKQFITHADDSVEIEEIAKRAIESAIIPVCSVFAVGKSLSDVLEYAEKLKKNTDTEITDSASKQQENTPESRENKEEHDSFKTMKFFDPNMKFAKLDEVTLEKHEDHGDEPDDEKSDPEIRDIESLSAKYRRLSAALLDVVKGQDTAVRKLVEGCFQGELFKQTESGNHPRSYFFFFGPPGTGKTLLAETAASVLELPFKKYDMSDYSSPMSYEELVGTSKNYSNSREGDLVRFVKENPECLLIFDEIEKADISVIRLFLTVLGSGYLRSKHSEREVSFRKTIIIFTSNVGKELYADRNINLSNLPEKVLIDAIRREKNGRGEQVLPEEICSRIASGNTILFNHLSLRQLTGMINDSFEKVISNMNAEYGVSVSYSFQLPLLFLYNRGSEIDARIASEQSRNFLKKELYELTRQLENRTQNVGITSISFDVDWDGIDDELKELFVSDEKAEILIMADSKTASVFKTLNDKYIIHTAESMQDAAECLKNDISAVFIDPFFGRHGQNEMILSISDYDTEGVRLFHNITEKETGLPVYLIDTEPYLTEVDKRTFLQEGAADTVRICNETEENFVRQAEQIMQSLYMEKKNQEFSQRGWVIDYKTKQSAGEDGRIQVLFYDLKKRLALDMDSRGSVLSEAQRPNVKFEDIIGAQSAKDELQYFIKYLQNPRQFLMRGGRPPKGVLLYGPPGTGKTMLAKAMAGESDVTFLQTNATDFKNKYVGESEANIRRIFAKAKKYAPSIIFIDEIDAIGKKRTGSEMNSTTESMLNTLLTEMDGFSSSDSSKPVFVLAATNYGAGTEYDGVSSLDEALIRRFDNTIYVDLPNETEREQYIELILKKNGITGISEKTAKNIAERTTGQSLAVIQNVVELALRNAAKEDRALNDDDLLTSLEDYVYGEKKEHTPEYYKKVAIHETGHAYMAYISGDKPSYITIESRGHFGGYIQHSNPENVSEYTRDDLIKRIRISLAGRVAEQIFYGKEESLNTGASSDLKQATELAWKIVCEYGMESDQLIVLQKKDILQSAMAAEYVVRINNILVAEMKNTLDVLRENRNVVESIAEVLMKENRLTGEQFEEILKKNI